MTKAEQEFLIMCAVDYTIKRHTSAPNEMVRIISNYWEEYSNSLQVYILTQIKNNQSTCDPSWFKILKLWKST